MREWDIAARCYARREMSVEWCSPEECPSARSPSWTHAWRAPNSHRRVSIAFRLSSLVEQEKMSTLIVAVSG
jgi:hypothetical protein